MIKRLLRPKTNRRLLFENLTERTPFAGDLSDLRFVAEFSPSSNGSEVICRFNLVSEGALAENCETPRDEEGDQGLVGEGEGTVTGGQMSQGEGSNSSGATRTRVAPSVETVEKDGGQEPVNVLQPENLSSQQEIRLVQSTQASIVLSPQLNYGLNYPNQDTLEVPSIAAINIQEGLLAIDVDNFDSQTSLKVFCDGIEVAKVEHSDSQNVKLRVALNRLGLSVGKHTLTVELNYERLKDHGVVREQLEVVVPKNQEPTTGEPSEIVPENVQKPNPVLDLPPDDDATEPSVNAPVAVAFVGMAALGLPKNKGERKYVGSTEFVSVVN